MRCKIFYAMKREVLAELVNTWLETHAVQIEHTQFSQVLIEDEVQYVLENTLVLFYVPHVDEQGETK